MLVAFSLAALLGTLFWAVRNIPRPALLHFAFVSVLFAALAFALRSATPPAAVAGGLVCFALCLSPRSHFADVAPSGLLGLISLFVLTTSATRFGRARKQRLGLAEARHGRRTSQVMANLGVAALCAASGHYPAALAALAEATADTVSSEVGQAVGGPTWMITSLRRVSPGTDGGISLRGTLAGIAAALIVCATATPADPHALLTACLASFAATAGLLFDSLLGATLERRGLLGNDLVNASSTLFSAVVASFGYALLLR